MVSFFAACSLPCRLWNSAERVRRLRVLGTANAPQFIADAAALLAGNYLDMVCLLLKSHFPTLFLTSQLYYTLPHFITHFPTLLHQNISAIASQKREISSP
jgi:hypothetical protein